MNLLFHLGQFVILVKRMFAKPENWGMYWKELLRQMNDIGIGSLVIVMVISVFIGAVTAVQFAYQLESSFVPPYYIGYIVRDSTIIEMAPTITCLVLAGKVGSNMAAEIGGMRQKEQIDALDIMGVNTASFLIMPRVMAAAVVIPMLVAIAAFVCCFGGYFASIWGNLVSAGDYVIGMRSFFEMRNVTMMFVKAFVFGLILTSVSCYKGYFVTGGSIELGQASTQAVVYSNILILAADYLIAIILT